MASGAKEADISLGEQVFVVEDRECVFDVKDAKGVPVDMSSYALRFQVRLTPDSAAVFTKNTGGGGITLENFDGVNDRVRVALAAADLALLTGGADYVYGLMITTSGSRLLLAEGAFKPQKSPVTAV